MFTDFTSIEERLEHVGRDALRRLEVGPCLGDAAFPELEHLRSRGRVVTLRSNIHLRLGQWHSARGDDLKINSSTIVFLTQLVKQPLSTPPLTDPEVVVALRVVTVY